MEKQFGFVVILDALGVSNYKIDESAKFLAQKNKLLKQLEKEAEDIASLFNETVAPSSKTNPPIKYAFPKTTICTFGDTIVICWPTETDEKSLSIAPGIFFWLQRAIVIGLDFGILLRGAIAVGEYLIEDNITLIGPAVADASAWSEEADWFGVILTPKCRYYLTAFFENSKMPKDTPMSLPHMWCVKYSVPLHQREKELFAVSWPFFYLIRDENKISGYIRISRQLSKMSIPKGVESKYENSLSFFKWYEEKQFATIEKHFPIFRKKYEQNEKLRIQNMKK